MNYTILQARQIEWASEWQHAVDQAEPFLDSWISKALRDLNIPKSYHSIPEETKIAWIWNPDDCKDYERPETNPNPDFKPDSGLEFQVELLFGKDVNSRFLRQGIGRISISNYPGGQEVVYFPPQLRIPPKFFTDPNDLKSRERHELVIVPYNALIDVYRRKILAFEQRGPGEFLDYPRLFPATVKR